MKNKLIVLFALIFVCICIFTLCSCKQDSQKIDNVLEISADDIVYGDTPNVVVKKNISEGEITINYKEQNAADSKYNASQPTDAGGYTVKVTSAEKGNYKETSVTKNFTIAKANFFVNNANNIVTTFVYTGQAHSISGVTGSGDISFQNNSFTDFGTYMVTINVAESSNYKSGSITKVATVNKAQYNLSNTSFANTVYKYDGTPKVLTFTGNLPQGVSVSYTANTLTELGALEVVAKFTHSNSNYEPIDDKVAILTIEKDDAVINMDEVITTFDYTGESQSISGVTGSGEVSYVNNSFTDAGTYTVTANVAESDYNKSGTTDIEVTVNKIDYDTAYILFENSTFVYDGQPQSIAITGELPQGVTVIYYGNEVINVGRYTVTAIFEGDYANYNEISDLSSFIIIDKAIPEEIIWPTNSAITYGQKLEQSTLSGESVNGVFVWQNKDVMPDVATTTAKVIFVPHDAENYDYSEMALEQEYSITVNKKTLTVTADNKIYTYGDQMEFTYVIGGFVEGEDESVLTLSPQYDNSIIDVGEYIDVIMFGNAVSDNYDFTFIPGNLTINTKQLDAPVLFFDGTKITWGLIDYATNYTLSIDEIEEETGLINNYYELPSAYDYGLTIRVKAIPTDPCCSESEYSQPLTRLDTPSELSVSNGEIVWNAVDEADEYILYVNDSISLISQGTKYMMLNQAEGDYTISIIAVGDNLNTFKSAKSQEIQVHKLSNQLDLIVDNNILKWNTIQNATGYNVVIYNERPIFVEGTELYLNECNAGLKSIYVYATGDNSTYINSSYSNTVSVTKLYNVTDFTVQGNTFMWTKVELADYYSIMINDNEIIVGDVDNFVLGESYEPYEYNVKIRAGNTAFNTFLFSDFTAPIIVTKLAKPTNISVVDGLLTWTAIDNATKYVVKIDQSEYISEENTFSATDIIEEGLCSISVMSMGDDTFFVDSDYYLAGEYDILGVPYPINNQDGAFVLMQITNASCYEIMIDGVITGTMQVSDNFYFGDTYEAGQYDLRIRAKGDNTYLSSGFWMSEDIDFIKLATPENISIIDGKLNFDPVENACGYIVRINDNEYSFDETQTNIYLPEEVNSGVAVIKVIAIGDEYFLRSDYTNEITATRLSKPEISIMNGEIRWNNIINTTGYLLSVDGEEIDVGNVTNYVPDDIYNKKMYTFSLRAKGSSSLLSSQSSEEFIGTRLDAPQDLDYSEGWLTWTQIPDAAGYIIEIDGDDVTIESGSITTCNVAEYGDINGMTISIKAKGDNQYLDSIFIDYYPLAEGEFYYLYEETLYYQIEDELYISIKGVKNPHVVTDIVVPETINDKPVLVISDNAFENCVSLERIELSSFYNYLGTDLFKGCNALKEITVPMGPLNPLFTQTIESIKYYFGGSTYSVTGLLPTSLKTINVSEGCTELSSSAFWGCTYLENIVLPSSMTNVNKNAIVGCSALKTLTAPLLDTYNTDNNSYLKYYFGGTTYSSGNNIPQTLESFTLTSGSTVIGENAFRNCSSLKTIILPHTITAISDKAFQDCTNLTTLLLPESVVQIGKDILKGCQSLEEIALPFSSENAADTNSYLKYFFGGISYDDEEIIIPVSLTSVIVNEGTEGLCDYAFKGCHKIESITLPQSLLSIGDSVFENCTNLSEISVPEWVGNIGDSAFKQCSNLQNVTLPELTEISDNLFYNCTALSTIVLPQSLTLIGDNAFYGCRLINDMILSKTLIDIGEYAFWDVFADIVFEEESVITSIGKNAFNNYKGSSIVLPNSITVIGEKALYKCRNITDLLIPNEVTVVGNNAFNYCDSLESLELPNSLSSIGMNLLIGCNSLISLIVSLNNSLTNGYLSYYFGGTTYNNATIPATLTDVTLNINTSQIVENAFNGCKSIESITFLTESFIGIKEKAFYDCSNLSTIRNTENIIVVKDKAFHNTAWFNAQANGMVYIGKIIYAYKGKMYPNTIIFVSDGTIGIAPYAFYNQENLIEINMPDSIMSLGKGAFEGCSGLYQIALPANLIYLDERVFASCTSLESISLPEMLMNIPNYVFENCHSLNNIIISKSVSIIDDYAFFGCSNLNVIIVDPDSNHYRSNDDVLYNHGATEIVRVPAGKIGDFNIPNSVTSIKAAAFEGCINLDSITIPASVVAIGENAFNGVHVEITFDAGTTITALGNKVFKNYLGVELTIPGTIETIGDSAFEGCINLETLIIPASVFDIGEYAFSKMQGSVTFDSNSSMSVINSKTFRLYEGQGVSLPDSIIEIETHAFIGCTNLINITISDNLIRIGRNAFENTTWYNNSADGVVYIGKVVYGYKGNMSPGTVLEIKEGTKAIADYAFYGRNGFSTIILPESMLYIGKGAFYWCTNLNYVVISKNVAGIGTYAFNNCSDLRTVSILTETPPILEDNIYGDIFSNAHSQLKIYVPIDSSYDAGGWQVYIGKYGVVSKVSFINGESVTHTNVAHNMTVVAPRLERPGYSLEWCSDEICETLFDFDTKLIEANLILYAKWTANEYSVTFNYNGADFGNSIEDMTVEYGWEYGALPSPTKTGHSFVGWFIGEEEITPITIVQIIKDESIVAVWLKDTYTVTFDYDGADSGNGTIEAIVEYNSEYGTLPDPTKEGYQFVGWFLEEIGINRIFSTSKVLITGDHTLYAIWEEE